MVHGLYCDACGEALLVESNVRYVTKVELYAAYDPLEITEEDLEGANRNAWEALIQELEDAPLHNRRSESISFRDIFHDQPEHRPHESGRQGKPGVGADTQPISQSQRQPAAHRRVLNHNGLG